MKNNLDKDNKDNKNNKNNTKYKKYKKLCFLQNPILKKDNIEIFKFNNVKKIMIVK